MSIPKLRFNEFVDNWKQNKIGDISNNITAGATPSTLNKDYWGGNIRWMNSGELNLKKVFEVENRITELGLKKSSTKLLPKKCVLIGLAGQGKTRGTVAMNMIELCTNQSIAAIHPNSDKFNEEFLYHNLDNRYDELRGLSTGDGGRGGLNLQIIKSMTIFLPSLNEQTKIANFLTAVDEKITQLTQKSDLLAQYKKGVMQKVFSQELRFKDDDGREFPEWTKDNLLNLSASGFTNGVFNDPAKVGSGYKLINVLDMYIDTTIDENNLSLVELSEAEFKKNKVKYGDTFFTRSSLVKSGIAFSNVYMGTSNDVTFDGHLIKMSPKLDKIDPFFLNYILRTAEVRKQLITRGKTATMTTIGQADIAEVNIDIPSLKEQTKIANFLTSIDDKITQTQAELEAMKQYKQGLLQQMFV